MGAPFASSRADARESQKSSMGRLKPVTTNPNPSALTTTALATRVRVLGMDRC
jgi:hypothetical protein